MTSNPITPEEITTSEKIEKLPWSIATNAANSVFVQFTYFGSAFVLFLNALNFSKAQVGFQLSLLQFSSLASLFVVPLVTRMGYKRTYLSAFGLRTLVTAGLLLVPFVLPLGSQPLFWYITIIIGLFALLRSIGITAFFPWVQEYVPNAIRGRFSANNNLITSLIGFIAVAIAGTVLDLTQGLTGYWMLFSAALVFGVLALWTASKRPGGAPAEIGAQTLTAVREFRAAVRDQEFKRYLYGVGLITLAVLPLGSFVPLFLQEQIGIDPGRVVFIQTGLLIGAMVSTAFWGWAADRYGSRPIMLMGTLIWSALPLAWLLMPRDPVIGFYLALVIAFAQGTANMGWLIGRQRLLYNRIVPPSKKTSYLAMYAAMIGVAGGISLLFGGWIIDLSAGLSGQFGFFSLDPYSGLFLVGLGTIILSILLLRTVQDDAQVSVDEFAGLFLRGNPFAAVTSMIRYHLADEERATVETATRLAETHSPLVVEELLELLVDPRFAVRMEAVVAIAHTHPDPRLVQALIDLLPGTELALSVMAAWALGRLGDPVAIGPLRQELDSPYPAIRVQAVRALAALGDNESVPVFLERLHLTEAKGLRMAYAAALGQLQAVEAIPQLLATLDDTDNQGARFELALSIARTIGDEGSFVDLLQQSRTEIGRGTALAQKANTVRKTLQTWLSPAHNERLAQVGEALARENLQRGATLLSKLICQLPLTGQSEHLIQILQASATQLGSPERTRVEFIMLALHALQAITDNS